jgi:hypothetical protein
MKIFNFHAQGFDFGNWAAKTEIEAKEIFAKDAGYISWAAMIDQAEEFGGNTVEFKEIN